MTKKKMPESISTFKPNPFKKVLSGSKKADVWKIQGPGISPDCENFYCGDAVDSTIKEMASIYRAGVVRGVLMGVDTHVKLLSEEIRKYVPGRKEELSKIKEMSRESMCHLYRFAKSGHPYFISGTVLNDVFMQRFNELGGFSPEISKSIGWDPKE